MIDFIKKQLQAFARIQGITPTSNLQIRLNNLNLLALLKGQSLADKPICPAIYWQNKNQQQTILCLGAIEQHNKVPQATPQASYYGGLAFQQQGKQWPGFPASCFIRPALEFKQSKQALILICHFNGQHKVTDTLALVQQLQPSKALETIKNKVLKRSDLPQQQEWAELIELAIENKAELPKVVLSRQTELLCQSKVNHPDLLYQLQQANPNNFHFSIQFCPQEAYIGSSPERLLLREKQELKTEALAGTINRGRNKREDQLLLQSLLIDKKIDRENYLVQEFIVSNLKALKAQVSSEEARIVQQQSVQHLCIPINASLPQQTTDSQLLQRLHPTPAVAGCPKQAAIAFINRNEPYPRGWYAGTIGCLTADRSDFCVAIRSALIRENKVKLYAGAGIVTGSIAKQEWQELENKIATLLEIIDNG